MNERLQALRLAFRTEGVWWVAYVAEPETMKDAFELGRARLQVVDDEERRQAFIQLMTSYLGDVIRDAGLNPPDSWDFRPAPESERAGNC